MEAYSNCRQFNCVTPIVEQSEYHMFCRDKAELYLPELYNKIGVGFMAWSPISMSLSENSERLLFTTKGSLKNKSQSYLWSEDDLNKEVRIRKKNLLLVECWKSFFSRIVWRNLGVITIKFENWGCWQRNLAARQLNYQLHGRSNMRPYNVC